MSIRNSDIEENLMKPPAEEECIDWDDGEEEPAPTGKASSGADASTAAESDNKDLCIAICSLVAAVPALVGSWCWPILVGAIFAVAASNVNGGLIEFFHGVQVAIMLALMTNIVQFAYWNVGKKRKFVVVDTDKGPTKVKAGHWYVYRPVYLLMFATVLVCLQPVCMLVIGSWICDGEFSSDQIDLTQVSFDNVTNTYVANGTTAGHYLPDGTFSQAAKDMSTLIVAQSDTQWPAGCSSSMKNFFFDGGVSNALVPNTSTGWMIQIFGTYLGFICMFVGVCQATMLHVKIAKKWSALRGGTKGTAV